MSESESNPPETQDPATLSLRELASRLKPSKIWTIVASLVALVVGAFSAGIATSQYAERVVAEGAKLDCQQRLNEQAAAHSKEIAESVKKRNDLQSQIDNLQKELSDSKMNVDRYTEEQAQAVLHIKFLDHYLRYQLSLTGTNEDKERSKNLFVEFVHRLWKAQEESAIEVAFESRPRTITERVPVVVRRPQVGPLTSPTRTTTFEDRTRTIQEKVIKIVTFPDGSQYVVPYEIAVEVHKRG